MQRHNNYKNRFNKSRTHNNNNKTNSNNTQINQTAVKRQLINYIYETITVSKYKYKIIQFENELDAVQEDNYMASANYNGTNCFAVFKKFNDKYYSFIVDRRTLSYNEKQLDYNKIEIIPINARMDESIYKGTIFDGVLLYESNNDKKNKRSFIINDIYFFRGENISGDKILYKMINIDKYLELYYKDDDQMNSVELIVNKLYELGNIRKLIYSYIPNAKHTNFIKGIAFFPEKSGTKLLYLYNNCAKDVVEFNQQPENAIINDKTSDTSIKDSTVAAFRMKKTDTIDVYELSLSKIFNKDGKKFIRYKKIGLAYLPTQKSSHFCKNLFDTKMTDNLIVDCKYINEKERWLPLKLSEKKIPDSYDSLF